MRVLREDETSIGVAQYYYRYFWRSHFSLQNSCLSVLEPMIADLSDDAWRKVATFITSTVNVAATAGSSRRLNEAMKGELQCRKGLCACGCLMELRHRAEDFPVYNAGYGDVPDEVQILAQFCTVVKPRRGLKIEGYPYSFDNEPDSTVRINCFWSRGVIHQDSPIFHCPSVALLYNWDHMDAFRRKTAWHRSNSKKWHCNRCWKPAE
jgi:hypothetical protein